MVTLHKLYAHLVSADLLYTNLLSTGIILFSGCRAGAGWRTSAQPNEGLMVEKHLVHRRAVLKGTLALAAAGFAGLRSGPLLHSMRRASPTARS